MASETTPDLLLQQPTAPNWDATELFTIGTSPVLFEVTNTNPNGTGSLKQAIVDASLQTSEECCVIFSPSLFQNGDSVTIDVDASNPLGVPKGKIFIGADLIGKKVVLNFANNTNILSSNNSIQLGFNNIVFKSAKRTTNNPNIYCSYTGGDECWLKFEKCAFIDFDCPGGTLLFGTSGSSNVTASFLNSVFVVSAECTSSYGQSWLVKSSNTNKFEHCTVHYPAGATGVPVTPIGENVKNSLILSEQDLSEESWASSWNDYNIIRSGDIPAQTGNETTSVFACLHEMGISEKTTKTSAVDYWGKLRQNETAFGAIRSAFIPTSSLDSVSSALSGAQIKQERIKNTAVASAVCFTLDDYVCNIVGGNTTQPTFPEGSYVWKTNNWNVASLPFPESTLIYNSDVILSEEFYDFSPSGFKFNFSAPDNSLVALPNYSPAGGVLAFNYSTCIANKTTAVIATRGFNIIRRPFWLPPLFSAVSGSVSVLNGNNWKDKENNVLQGFSGCDKIAFNLSANVTAVADIVDDWIELESIEFTQNGKNVVYTNTTSENVTQRLKDAGLIHYTDNSFITSVFGSLAQTALYALDVPIAVEESSNIF